MNRRDLVFETGLALFAVTAIVVGNFLVQRWSSAGQTARVADAAADLETASDSLPRESGSFGIDDFIPPQPVTNRSTVRSANRLKQLENLIAKQLPDASFDERDVWRQQLQDLPLETAAGILELRRQLGVFSELSPSATELIPFDPSGPLGLQFAR